VQCKAHSKRTGQRCKAQAVTGRTLCYHHGGRSLVGLANPNFRDGRHSRYLPKRLNELYAAALADPELLALRDDIALVDARIADVLTRADTGESGRLWRDLQATFRRLNEAKTDPDAVRRHLRDLGELIERGTADDATWAEVRALIEQRRRLVESEAKRLVQGQHMITADRLNLLLAVVVQVVRTHVHDRATLAAISADLGALVAGEPGGGPVAG